MVTLRRLAAMVELCVAMTIMLMLPAANLQAGPDEWVRIGPVGGRVSSAAVHPTNPDIIYALADGKLYATLNSGETWTLNPTCPSPVSLVSLDPSNGNTIYVLASFASCPLYKSTDAGLTWTSVSGGNRTFTLDKNQPNRLFVGGTRGSVRKSLDGDNIWTDISIGSAKTVAALAVSPGDSSTLYAGMRGNGTSPGDGVYKSVNGGTTWTQVSTGLPQTDISLLVVDPMHPETALVATSGGTQYSAYGVYRSTNGGESWSAANAGLPCVPCEDSLIIDDLKAIPGQGAAFCVVANGKAFRTENGGDTWNPYSAEVNDFALTVEFLPSDPDTRFFGGKYGLWRVTPASVDRLAVAPVPLSRVAVNPHDGSTLYGAADIAYVSRDGGLHWERSADGAAWESATAIAISPGISGSIFVGGYIHYAGLFRSDDGGISWDNVLADVAVTDVEIDPVDWNIVYAGGPSYPGAGGLLKSTDNGFSWAKVNNSSVYSIAVDPLNHTTVYIGTYYTGVKKSTDGGASWVSINNGLPPDLLMDDNYILSIAIDPLNPNILYCVLRNDVWGSFVFKSTNAGAGWTAASSGLSPWAITNKIVIDPVHPSILYAPTFQGAFRSINGARTWETMNTGLPDLGLNDLVIDPSNSGVVYCSSAYGLFRYESSYDPTAVDRPPSAQPFSLRNFPNPFSSATTVEYSVSSAMHVRVNVFDFAGRVVATLVDAPLEPGHYAAHLRGTKLSAGVYFIEGRFGDRTITKKCVLIK